MTLGLRELRAPNVDVHCLHGVNVSTPASKSVLITLNPVNIILSSNKAYGIFTCRSKSVCGGGFFFV